MVEDIALMRVLPRMKVLVPADFNSAKASLRIAAQTDGPVYIRMGRASVHQIYDANAMHALGASHILREGADVTIVAAGVEVDQALQAATLLEYENISAEVIDVFSIKPLDEATLGTSIQKTGCVVTAEEHSIIGGLGSAIAEFLGENMLAPLERVGMKDTFGTSGEFEELLPAFNLDAASIAAAAKRVIARKA